MKKLFRNPALTFAALAAVTLVSCSDDNESRPFNPDAPTVSHGAFILNEGSYYNNIEGDLSVVNFGDATVANGVFAAANGRSIGAAPQCGISYGSKVYIGTYESNTIEIIDRHTYKSIKQIRLEDSEFGSQPRSMVARDGQVYISMYDGHVCRLDTIYLEIKESLAVGPNPEVMAIHGNELYVPETNGANYQDGYAHSATVINLLTFSVERRLTNLPLNPTRFFSVGGKLFLLAMGDYATVNSRIYEMTPAGETTPVAKATMACADNRNIYFVNAPFFYIPEEGDTQDDKDLVCKYSKYDVASGKTTGWSIARVDYPSDLAVDPVSGKFMVASYNMDGIYPSYTAPGYVNEYNADNTLVKKYAIGSGPAHIFFIND